MFDPAYVSCSPPRFATGKPVARFVLLRQTCFAENYFTASFALAKSRAGGNSVLSFKLRSPPPAAPAVRVFGVAGNQSLDEDLPHRVKPPCGNARLKQSLPCVKAVFFIRSKPLDLHVVGIRARIVRQDTAGGSRKTGSPYARKSRIFPARNEADMRTVDFCGLCKDGALFRCASGLSGKSDERSAAYLTHR